MGKASRLRFAIIALIALAIAGASRLRAQNETIPPEVAALFEDIADIDKLRVLNPLKLTSEQIDKLIQLINKSKRAYDSALAAAAAPPIRSIAKDIKETRRRMLEGASIPTDLDNKVKQLQDSFVKKREDQDVNTLKSMSDEATKILTPSQKSKAVSLARKALSRDNKPAAQGDDDKFFNFYVMSVFIKYPRIIPLLEDMKRSASAG